MVADPSVGWLGLGSMGGLVVERLLAAGHDVTGWNRTARKAEPLVAKGMARAPSAWSLAARSCRPGRGTSGTGTRTATSSSS